MNKSTASSRVSNMFVYDNATLRNHIDPMPQALAPIRSVSIIMPTFNEAGNIANLIRDCALAVHETGVSQIEIIVVDDDSPDQTWRVAEETGTPHATVRVLRRLGDHGLT